MVLGMHYFWSEFVPSGPSGSLAVIHRMYAELTVFVGVKIIVEKLMDAWETKRVVLDFRRR